jgi:hypothetical protein
VPRVIEEADKMSETVQPGGAARAPAPAAYQGVQPSAATGWVGWIAFAGVMMLMLGMFHVVQGLVALFRDEYFLVSSSGLALEVDFTTWGWIHLLGGVVVIAAGIGLFAGRTWARSVAVALALLSAIASVGFLAAYPIWSTIMIAVDILVIWAVIVHGSEMQE